MILIFNLIFTQNTTNKCPSKFDKEIFLVYNQYIFLINIKIQWNHPISKIIKSEPKQSLKFRIFLW